MVQIKYFSAFTGIGGFELGIEQAYVEMLNRNQNGAGKENPEKNAQTGKGLESEARKIIVHSPRRAGKLFDRINDERAPACVGYSEIDKYAIQVYEKHFNHKNYGDITKINAEELPDFDLFVGGFPCQAFSIAGLRRGFDDTRGTLFFDIARILQKKQPRLLLLENVKGLLSHNGGRTFKTIIATLTELGYDLQWQVLNSKNFGVPQNRERVFIVGNLRGTPRPEVFPVRESNGIPAEKLDGKAQATHPIRAGYKAGQGGNDFIIHNVYGGFGEKKPREDQQPKIIEDFYPDRVRVSDGAPTLRSGRSGLKIATSCAIRTRKYAGQDAQLEVRKDEVSNTIDSVTKDYMALTGAKIRRLTPKECERLQGFPDDWTKESAGGGAYQRHTKVQDVR